MAWDCRRRCVVERAGLFELRWDVRFHPPGRIVVRTTGAALCIGGRRLPLPGLLVPDVRAVEDALGRGRIRIDLVLRVPLVGPVFGYAGTFTLRHAA